MPDAVVTPLPLEHIDADYLRAFETYRNYLERFCAHSRAVYPSWEDLAKACVAATEGLRPLEGLDLDWIRRLMGIAWNTECLMRQVPNGSDLVRIQNAWLPVQAYYAVYSASEAVAYVIDGGKAEGHTKALRKVTSILTRGTITPWNLAYSGAKGRDGRQHQQKTSRRVFSQSTTWREPVPPILVSFPSVLKPSIRTALGRATGRARNVSMPTTLVTQVCCTSCIGSESDPTTKVSIHFW